MAIRSLKTGAMGRSALAGNPLSLPGSFESIATVVVGAGGTSAITFSSIPQTYSHLQIRAIHQEPADTMAIQVNSQTGNAYTTHSLLGDGGAVASAYASPSMVYWGANYGSSGSNFGSSVLDILDYSNPNKATVFKSITGSDNNSVYSKVGIYSGCYFYTNVITSIVLKSRSGSTIAQYSHFALYGIA